ncbi:MAG: hypothetical protein ABUS49_08190 [Acidobacteriota bacterium]
MGTAAEPQQSRPDPLLYSHPLPLVQTFYPFGRAVELATDSTEIAEAAATIWSRYPKLSDRPAVRLRIAVSPHDAAAPVVASMPRGQEHLVSLVHGPENFAVADLARCFAFACLTRDVARDRPYCIYHFLEPLAYLLLSANGLTVLHAACVALHGRAVLLSGDSGAGKTCLSYACARRGWTFLSGDALQFARDEPHGMVIGRPFSLRFRASARALFPELGPYEAGHRLNGKLDIEPPIDDLKIAIALQARATHIVFLARSPGARPPALRPVPAREAFRRLENVFFFGDDQLRSEQKTALYRFMQPLASLEMAYTDLGEAESALRALVT